MAHTSGFLSGPEPEELEEKTAAQLDDERQTESMRASRSMYQLAEDDETPAIEQKAAQQGIIQATSTKPKLEADKNFAAEMHARAAAEQKTKEQAEKAAKAKQQNEKAANVERLKADLAKPQSLDPEEIKTKRQQDNFRANLQKIYPDRIEQHDQVDDALWRQNSTTEKPLPDRARLVDQFNSQLHRHIIWSFVFQALALALFAIGFSVAGFDFGNQTLFLLIEVALSIAAMAFLYHGGETCRRKLIPSEQQSLFIIASNVPAMIIRIALSFGFSHYLKFVTLGQIIGILIGLFIGAAIQYDLLNRYHTYPNFWIVIINTIIFAIIDGIYVFNGDSPIAIILFIVGVIGFFASDRLAFRIAKVNT